MVRKAKKEQLMSYSGPALEAVDQIRQLNRMFLTFLRERPRIAVERFGLSSSATSLLKHASLEEIERAADFPRALFGFRLPELRAPGTVADDESPAGARLVGEPERHVLQLTLLHSAWYLCRSSGYSARLLLRLGDAEVARLRAAEMSEIVTLSQVEHLVHAAFDHLEWIWRQLLKESRPEHRRRLWLIGLQPDAIGPGRSGG